MEPVEKLQRLTLTVEDAIRKGVKQEEGIIPHDVAFSILQLVDARDAMNWTRGAGRDLRFRSFVREMQSDRIWRYWTQRDMADLGVVVHAAELIPYWARADTIVEFPRWKMVYLWYRLALSCYQAFILRVYQEPYTAADLVEDLYPPGTTLRLKQFNVIEISGSGSSSSSEGVELRDFRDEFPRMLRNFRQWRPEPNIKIIATYPRFFNQDMRRLEINWHLKRQTDRFHVAKCVYEKYTNYITRFLGTLLLLQQQQREPYTNADTIWKASMVNVAEKSYPRRLPRIYEPTKLLVAAPICASCAAPSPAKRCSCPCAAPYCGVECQEAHHKLV